MADDFQIAPGHNNVAGLAGFVPYPPKTPGLQYTRSTPYVGGNRRDEGPFILFTWGQISEPQYQAMLTQGGLLTVKFAPVTLHAQDENYVWVDYNGWAVKPLLGQHVQRNGYWLNNVRLLVKGLQLVSV